MGGRVPHGTTGHSVHTRGTVADHSPPPAPKKAGSLSADARAAAPAAPATVYSAEEITAGEAELELLRAFYKSVLNKHGSLNYARKTAKGVVYKAAEYLRDRDALFGSRSKFEEQVALCRSELDEKKESLRASFDPPKKQRTGDWKKAQDVYYAWLRKKYEETVPAGTDIAALIRAGMSEKLKTALKQVKADYGKYFATGGFNPRPIKTTKGQRLGTISDHALGLAVDIEDKKNAQVEAKDWTALCAMARVSTSKDVRASTWETAPKTLYDHVKLVNDTYVAKMTKALAGQAEKGTEEKARIAAVRRDDKALALVSAAFMTKWPGAFFTLEWTLVKELHEEGLIWGATFDRVDLHHFEL
jgi:hypothetical protein